MLTKVGIIYSVSQKVRRDLIISDFDDSEIDIQKERMTAGEGWLDIPLEIYSSFKIDPNNPASGSFALDNYIALQIGESSSDKCAVVDSGNNIVAVICADPIIDSHPDGILIQDDNAITGLQYDLENQTVVMP